VTASLATENTEFMLEGNDLELACIQNIGCTYLVFYSLIVDLKANGGWIIVDLAMIRHRNDTSVQGRA
jgi:hypothetical protein